MKKSLFKSILCLFLLLLLSMSFLACSKNKSPIEPATTNPDIPIAVADAPSNRSVLAVCDAVIDPLAKTFTLTPSSERVSDYHLPLTRYYPDVLQITRYGFTPIFWADIKITHPLPNSGIEGSFYLPTRNL